MIQPSMTLEAILELIDKDVRKHIMADTDKPLDEKTAQTLCRYATALSNIKDSKQKDEAKERKELESKSLDELIEEFQKSK